MPSRSLQAEHSEHAENLGLNEAAREHVAELHALVQVGIQLMSEVNLRELLDQIVEMARSVVDAEAGSLLLVDRETGELRFEVIHGGQADLEGTCIEPGQGIVGWVVQEGKPLLIADAKNDDRFFAGVDSQTGFVTRTVMCVPLRRHGTTIGALEVLNKEGDQLFNQHDLQICTTFGPQAAVSIENAQLVTDKDEAFLDTVEALATTLEFRDTATEGHSRRVRDYTLVIAREMGVPEDQMDDIGKGALLHDIGKIGVRDAILRKPGELNEAERAERQQHVLHGHRMLDGVRFLSGAADVPLHHHERCDGFGYPHGLKGEESGVGCRAFSVADMLDAITSDRPYRNGQPMSVAREEIRRVAGSQFDPAAVEDFDRIPAEAFAEMRRRVDMRKQ